MKSPKIRSYESLKKELRKRNKIFLNDFMMMKLKGI